MRIQVDQARCHGHQMCAIAAPKLFGSDEIGNAAVLIAGDVPRDLEAAETRRAVKEVTKTDVAQARARRARAVSAADLAKANLKVSRANFERIVGHAPQGLGMPSMKLKLLPRSRRSSRRGPKPRPMSRPRGRG